MEPQLVDQVAPRRSVIGQVVAVGVRVARHYVPDVLLLDAVLVVAQGVHRRLDWAVRDVPVLGPESVAGQRYRCSGAGPPP